MKKIYLFIIGTTLLQNTYAQVGIGTTSPTKDLDVNGEVRIRTFPAATNADAVLATDVNGNLKKLPVGSVGNIKTEPWENTDGTEATNSSTNINYTNGFVGIGTTNPKATLHVTNPSGDVGIIIADDTELGTPTGQDFEIVHTNPTTGAIDNRRFIIDSGGNVGVGLTNPSVKHEVAGKHQDTNVRTSISSSTNVSTTSTNWVDVTGFSLTVTTADSDLLILCGIPGVQNSGSDNVVSFRILVDNVQVGSEVEAENNRAYIWTSNLHAVAPVTSGSHTIKIQWKVQGSTGSINGNQSSHKLKRTLSVVEL